MKTFLTVSAFALVLASSCRNASEKAPADTVMSIAPQKAEVANLELFDAASDSIAEPARFEEKQSGNQSDQQPGQKQKPATAPAASRSDWNKKIIKNASLELEIKNFREFERLVSAITGKYAGYIAEENQESSDYKLQSQVSIRVPVDLFEQAVNEFTGNAEKILTKNITSKDVTGEVVDVRSRLEAKRQARLRYLELMKQAKNMEEVFQVQKEVDEIQEEIEAAAGRMGYLNHSSAYSTIQLVYFQILDPDLVNNNNHEPSFGTRVLDAFGAGFKWLGDVMVALITLWPMLLGVGLVVYAVKKTVKRNRAKPATSKVVEQAEA
ncbi:DUF4349 domain-containing protein [Pseudoflavitalea rhizosphaerae]|uniref:DUF4349 domain-containing protein n=1 Tax=Pseudoflavitalea rhizosphaerae TaxID=1884793 RepID=UPI000F8F2C76|nr:DUF4349 domain-containing protein [Pseudoflavitalea rhizosphaerae]